MNRFSSTLGARSWPHVRYIEVVMCNTQCRPKPHFYKHDIQGLNYFKPPTMKVLCSAQTLAGTFVKVV